MWMYMLILDLVVWMKSIYLKLVIVVNLILIVEGVGYRSGDQTGRTNQRIQSDHS